MVLWVIGVSWFSVPFGATVLEGCFSGHRLTGVEVNIARACSPNHSQCLAGCVRCQTCAWYFVPGTEHPSGKFFEHMFASIICVVWKSTSSTQL